MAIRPNTRRMRRLSIERKWSMSAYEVFVRPLLPGESSAQLRVERPLTRGAGDRYDCDEREALIGVDGSIADRHARACPTLLVADGRELWVARSRGPEPSGGLVRHGGKGGPRFEERPDVVTERRRLVRREVVSFAFVPTVLVIDGFRFFFFFFFSNEGMEPPHIQSSKERDGPAKFWLLRVELVVAHRMRQQEVRRARPLVEENQTQFLESWREYFGT